MSYSKCLCLNLKKKIPPAFAFLSEKKKDF